MKEALLVTIKPQRGLSVKDKIASHRKTIERNGSSYWGTGFTLASPPDPPFNLYVVEGGTGEIRYVANVLGVECFAERRRPRHPEFSPHYYFDFGFPYRTYFRIAALGELANPIPARQAIKIADGTPVSGAPQGYARIEDPASTL
jgi:hypothetical protein